MRSAARRQARDTSQPPMQPRRASHQGSACGSMLSVPETYPCVACISCGGKQVVVLLVVQSNDFLIGELALYHAKVLHTCVFSALTRSRAQSKSIAPHSGVHLNDRSIYFEIQTGDS